MFTGSIAATDWTTGQAAEFQDGIRIAGLTLTVVATALVAFGFARTRRLS